MSEVLKLCPKCGHAEIMPCMGNYRVQCDCQEWYDTEAEAIAAWNRHTPDPLAKELAEALIIADSMWVGGENYATYEERQQIDDAVVKAKKLLEG